MMGTHLPTAQRFLSIKMYIMLKLVCIVLCLKLSSGAFYDTFTGKLVAPDREVRLRELGLIPWCAVDVPECNPSEGRRFDGSCNNLNYPSRGALLTPFRRMLPPVFGPNFSHRPSTSGEPLPNARAVRVGIMTDGRVSSAHYTQMAVHMNLGVTADTTSIHDTVNYVVLTRTCCVTGEADPRCMPIRVADDDVHLRRSPVRCLNLTKVITYQRLNCAPRTLPPERINTSPPMLDLSNVYGIQDSRTQMSRERNGGRLRAEMVKSQEWPPNGAPLCINNELPAETRCNDGANLVSINALAGSTLITLLLFRNHNRIAGELKTLNPCWEDEKLFRTARDINIAFWQNIIYYELMPSLMGWDYLLKKKVVFSTLGHVDDYDETLEPRHSIEYVVGTRWFHTMQEGRMKLYDRTGKLLNELAIVDYTLRTGGLAVNNTLEGMIQGAFRQPAAAADHLVDPDMGERVLGRMQFASDVVSSDIMKGREAGMPPYNMYRQFCGLPVAKDFDDLKYWMPLEQAEAIQQHYETVEDVDIMVGILSERAMPGAAMGPTLACIMADQLQRWRRADRFWFEGRNHPGAFTEEQLYEIRQMSEARLLCDNGDEVDSIQPYANLLPDPGNEIMPCSEIRKPNLEPWKDPKCEKQKSDKPQEYSFLPKLDWGYLNNYWH